MGRWVGRQIDRREMDRLLVANKQIEWLQVGIWAGSKWSGRQVDR